MEKVRADECEVACQGKEPRVWAWGPVGIGKCPNPGQGRRRGMFHKHLQSLGSCWPSWDPPEGKDPGDRGFREFLNLGWGDSDPEYTLGFPLPSPLWEGKRIRKKVSITETVSKTSSWLQERSSVGLLEHKDHRTQVRRSVPYSNSITYSFLKLERITYFSELHKVLLMTK